jgi:DNA repair exonuclease SbcCD ATPase subunit
MILRGIHVENWRCIRRLDLDDLPDGIIVLHGPNRTGKSSLVRAIRCCLFDCDHDAMGKDIKASIPWDGGGPPKVIVEFTVSGAHYRLTKVFSKKKEGTALLEKKAGAGWQVEQDAPKEASRRARELLGSDKSSAGLNQLLWLNQGETALPDEENIDRSLEEKLVHVLGVMVTGRDLAFKHALDKRCATWFTEKTGRYKENCPVAHWQTLHEERLAIRDQELQKLRQWESAILQLQACEDELPIRHKAVERARTEVEQLQHERERSKERVRQYHDAEIALKSAADTLERAEEANKKSEQARERSAAAGRQLALVNEELQSAQLDVDERMQDHEDHAHSLELASQREDEHLAGRDQIEDRAKLVSIARQERQLDKVLQAVGSHEKAASELEEQLLKATAPDEKALKSLRDNRRHAGELRAGLQASTWTLTVTSARATTIELSLDGQACPAVDCQAEERRSWSIRQRALVQIGDMGQVEVARTQQALDLERMARDLARLDQEYEDGVRSYQQDPTDDSCLDRLAERRIQRESWVHQLKKTRSAVEMIAPGGQGALELERTRLEQQRQFILERRPDLASWEPRAEELEECEKQFKSQAAELERVRRGCEIAERVALEKLKQTGTLVHEHKEKLAAATALEKACRDELERLGAAETIAANLAEARVGRVKAEAALAANQLTEAEQTIDQRLTEAETSLQERNNRLRELEDKLIGLRTFLQGNEGLHTRLADAEAAVQEAENALAREKIEAEAHRRLRDLFEACRENQVQQVMGPIASRVLDWSRRIGLEDYQEVRFGDKFLPEGIAMGGATTATPIVLDEESYGTEEQLSILVRLALGGVLANEEPAVAILDDPLAHADPIKHRRMLEILRLAAAGNAAWTPPAGRLQILILTCHPDRFDHLPGARHIDLPQVMAR